jgi:Flp pilus assembly protein TadG
MTQRRPSIGERREAGTITLWMLGLCLMLFLLGGISLDLWRAFSERRSLAATADAAAVAGASALDEAAYPEQRRRPAGAGGCTTPGARIARSSARPAGAS